MRSVRAVLVSASVMALALAAAAQSAPNAGRGARAEFRAPTAPAPVAPVKGEERREGEAKVKVYRFGEFDIGGRLKSPQLLYFLNRVRGEFAKNKLPHRSFMPELRSTAHEKSL